MQLGGNAKAAQYFRQHNCTTTDAQQKYNSRAAQLYREKLNAAAQRALTKYGTNVRSSLFTLIVLFELCGLNLYIFILAFVGRKQRSRMCQEKPERRFFRRVQ